MKIHTFKLGVLKTNCYLAVDQQSKNCLIIDPADEGSYIIQKITDLNIKPVAIIATHCHFDHVLGSLEVKLAYNIPFLINSKDEFLLKRAQSSALHWLGHAVDPPAPPDGYIDNQTNLDELLTAKNYQLKAIETPGHTPGSTSLYSKESRLVFTGDTLFARGSVGRTDFTYASTTELNQSIQKLFQLPDETIIYPGHGEPSTIGAEKQIHMLQ